VSKNILEVKVSADNGDTWIRRKVNFGGEIEDSGLKAGEMFQLHGGKFIIAAGEDGLMVEPIKEPEREKSSIKKQPVKRK